MYQNLKILLLCILIAMSLFYFINSYNQESFSQNIERQNHKTEEAFSNKAKPIKNKTIFQIKNNQETNPVKKILPSTKKINIPDIKPINKETTHLEDLKLKHNQNSNHNINTNNIKNQLKKQEQIIKNQLNYKFNSFKNNLKPDVEKNEDSFLEFKNNTIEKSNKIKTSL